MKYVEYLLGFCKVVEKHRRVKLIVPDWDDIVDPQFDFRNESHSSLYRADRYRHGVRIWNIFDPPPLDGVLLSRSVLEKEGGKLRRIEREGVKEFLKLPSKLRNGKSFQVIGDCGAWQYRHYEAPPYDPIETLEFYQRLGFDYGVSVDHIALASNPGYRMEITFRNALKSFEVWKKRYEKGDYTFILLAAVQGLEVRDYVLMFEKLYSRGIRHFAIGGLAMRTTDFIERLVSVLHSVLSRFKDVEKIHFLGIARPRLATLFKKPTEFVPDISFDNATYLRIAWTRRFENYITMDARAYTAIRISGDSLEARRVLEYLYEYDEGRKDFEEVFSAVREYVLKHGDPQYLPYYASTLRDKPWKRCQCPICRSVGINVVIFRGNDRNRRRGFHNLFVFYNLLLSDKINEIESFSVAKDSSITITHRSDNIKELVDELRKRGINMKSISKVLILASCSKKKSIDLNKVMRLLRSYGLGLPSNDLENEALYRKILRIYIRPAEEMYRGIFSNVKKIANILRNHGKHVDIYIISARYGLIKGSDPIIPYEATLKGLKPSEIATWASGMGIPDKLRSILSNNYDLIIAVLPKEYAYAIKSVLPSLLSNPRTILITATSAIPRYTNIKALVLPGSNITKRVKSIKMLEEAIKHELTQ